jgi:hypothetical protein
VGQPVAVVEKPTTTPGVVRYEANRNFTGMGHERFTTPEQAIGPRPSAVIARRLFETGKVDAVHVYMNMVTIDVKKGFTPDGLADVLEQLYIYYRPGVVPKTFDAPAEEALSTGTALPSSSADVAEDALSEAAKRVPAHLLERSRAARERAKAKAAAEG